jgi:predicted transport protein
MPIFNINDKKLVPVKEVSFNLEKDIQSLSEANLETVFGLQFVTTELELNGLRIDTVAFNKEINSFVIIEYKRDRSFSIIDQGYAYLALMLNNKAEFILEFNEKTGGKLNRESVDWSQSKILFFANSFTTHQQQAINFRDLPIELWEVKKYSNNTILYNQLKSPDSNESIKTISKNSTIQKMSKEVKIFSVDDHFQGAKENIRPLYEVLKDSILKLDPRLKENPRAPYIGFMLGESGNQTLAYVHIRTNKLRVDIPRAEPKDVNDPSGKVRYQKGSKEHFNTPIIEIDVSNEEEASYAALIVRQVLTRVFK